MHKFTTSYKVIKHNIAMYITYWMTELEYGGIFVKGKDRSDRVRDG